MTKKQILGKWKKLEAKIAEYSDESAEVAESVKKLYSIYDPSLLVWLGRLFDPDIGGFYYSNSARDGEEFYPDIESTGQAIGILENTGVISSYQDIPESVRSKIACFICSCEDPESGYFYNPQWSKEEINSKLPRRGRDSRWAVEIAEMCNFEVPYPTIFARLDKGIYASAPECFKSEEKFVSYLNTLDWKQQIRKNLHWLNSQIDQIIAMGLGDALDRFIVGLRDPDTGLWGSAELGDVIQLRGTAGAVWYYSYVKKPIPDSERIVDFAVRCIASEHISDISYVSSCWGLFAKTVKLLATYGGDEGEKCALAIMRRYIGDIPRLIDITVKKLLRFRKSDNSFSYLVDTSSPTSQTMPVAKKNSNEGEINGTIIAISVAKNVVCALTLTESLIPLFDETDFDGFLNAVGTQTENK